ncbi:MAG TPA: DNA polymerase [Thermodesulfobacteriota bacterium]|nr:DNA polymerase [Thermodesulfobacteriota bacterium]
MPVKKPKSIKKNPCIIGLAIKNRWNGKEFDALSLHFARDNVSKQIPIGIGKETSGNKLNREILTDHLNAFLTNELSFKDLPKSVYLITQNAKDALSSFEDLSELKLREAKSHVFAHYKLENEGRKLRVSIKELAGINKALLNDLTKFAGVLEPNLETLEGLEGKDAKYWKENLNELWIKFPEVYEKFCNKEAEVAYQAYVYIRNFFIDKYQTDILEFNGIASIAVYVFRRNYLKKPLYPTRIEKILKFRKKGGEFHETEKSQEVYGGSLDVRNLALRASQGGRVESFYIGRIENENLAYYDVVSLYPSSAMLQPLPSDTTKWEDLTQLRGKKRNIFLEKGHGFIEVEFQFKKSVNYPCLPVASVRDKITYYPSSGISYCTLEELRLAKRIGLKHYHIKSGYAFLPRIEECNHPFKNYMEDLLKLKNEAVKGTIDYEMYKLLMNSLIGKTIEKNDYFDRNNPILSKRNGKRLTSTGKLWMPEVYTLILGKSRAIIGEFTTKGAYFVSTDSVLLPKSTPIECRALEELKSVGSDLKHEFDVTHGILLRTRLYALNPMEEDKNKRHIARHAIHASEDQFLRFIREGFKTKAIPETSYTKTRRLNLKDSFARHKPWNSPYEYRTQYKLKYDGKRNPENRIDNPFRSGTWTKPLSWEETVDNKLRKKPRKKYHLSKPRRMKKRKYLKPPSERVLEIIELYSKGKNQSDIARELKYTRQYVHKVIKTYMSRTETEQDVLKNGAKLA